MVLSSAGAASKFALLAVGAAAMVGLSACQVSGAASGGPSAAGPEVSQSAAGGKVPTGSGSDGKAPASGGSDAGSGGVGRCVASDLSVDIADQGSIAPAGTASWLLTATNTSGRSCTINGYPSFGLLDASGSMWSDSHTTYVRHPGAPMRTVLKPGGMAFAGVKWPICSSGDLAGGLVMTPPGDTRHTKVTDDTDSEEARMKLFKVCSHSVTAGSFQPIRQGVVFAS
jgi:hypothetical protein